MCCFSFVCIYEREINSKLYLCKYTIFDVAYDSLKNYLIVSFCFQSHFEGWLFCFLENKQ